MVSTLSSARPDFSEDHPWPTAEIKLLAELEKHSEGRPTKTSCEPQSVSAPKLTDLNAEIRPVPSKDKQPSLGRRTARGVRRFLIVFCMGVAVTLAWQSYGDATRQMIASSYPLLGWLAPQTAVAETAPQIISPTASDTTSDSEEQIKSILVNLAALRQSVDQLAAQSVASQQQMASDIAKLNDKISSAPPPRPAAAPARKPVPAPAPQLSEASPVR